MDFDKLKVSTSTVLSYSNLVFDHLTLFKNIPITDIVPPLTKKKKSIDKKLLKAPYGSIIGVQMDIYLRGIRTSKRKKYWCPYCQLKTVRKGKETEQLTVQENEIPLTEEELKTLDYPNDTKKILFICSDCKRQVDVKKLNVIVPFLNQISIALSIGNYNINIMLFDTCLKIAGNKSLQDAIETTMISWEEYISKISGWKFRRDINKNDENSQFQNNEKIHFLFSTAMMNVGFSIGFPIDKYKLNRLMNKKEYSNMIELSVYDSTSSPNVNIIMKPKEGGMEYYILEYKNAEDNKPIFLKSKSKLYAKKKNKDTDNVEFIVFSSSEVIMTGRNIDNMREKYDFFIKTVNEHKDYVMEKIKPPETNIMDIIMQVV